MSVLDNLDEAWNLLNIPFPCDSFDCGIPSINDLIKEYKDRMLGAQFAITRAKKQIGGD